MNNAVALIPARSGSKRLPNKNIMQLEGHPLLAYSIRAAIDSGVFDAVICATDDQQYADIATYYGAEVPCLRPVTISGDKSPDIMWVEWMLNELASRGRTFEAFSILRPTSPFRKADTIQRAWAQFISTEGGDSLRAVEKCKQHPCKMWEINGKHMVPILPYSLEGQPGHSSQYAALPAIYVQNASLEIAWTRVVTEDRTIAGEAIIPFISEGLEGFDINEPEDWLLAEHYLAMGEAHLPIINHIPYPLSN